MAPTWYFLKATTVPVRVMQRPPGDGGTASPLHSPRSGWKAAEPPSPPASPPGGPHLLSEGSGSWLALGTAPERPDSPRCRPVGESPQAVTAELGGECPRVTGLSMTSRGSPTGCSRGGGAQGCWAVPPAHRPGPAEPLSFRQPARGLGITPLSGTVCSRQRARTRRAASSR